MPFIRGTARGGDLSDIHKSDGWPRVALAAVRIVNGSLGLLLPHVLARRVEGTDQANEAAVYAFRLFGVRTLLVGVDLLAGGEVRRHAVRAAPLIHASDTVAAVIAARRGDLPRRSALMLTLLSGMNTALAVEAFRRGRKADRAAGARTPGVATSRPSTVP
jgi:hypothetical protein